MFVTPVGLALHTPGVLVLLPAAAALATLAYWRVALSIVQAAQADAVAPTQVEVLLAAMRAWQGGGLAAFLRAAVLGGSALRLWTGGAEQAAQLVLPVLNPVDRTVEELGVWGQPLHDLLEDMPAREREQLAAVRNEVLQWSFMHRVAPVQAHNGNDLACRSAATANDAPCVHVLWANSTLPLRFERGQHAASPGAAPLSPDVTAHIPAAVRVVSGAPLHSGSIHSGALHRYTLAPVVACAGVQEASHGVPPFEPVWENAPQAQLWVSPHRTCTPALHAGGERTPGAHAVQASVGLHWSFCVHQYDVWDAAQQEWTPDAQGGSAVVDCPVAPVWVRVTLLPAGAPYTAIITARRGGVTLMGHSRFYAGGHVVAAMVITAAAMAVCCLAAVPGFRTHRYYQAGAATRLVPAPDYRAEELRECRVSPWCLCQGVHGHWRDHIIRRCIARRDEEWERTLAIRRESRAAAARANCVHAVARDEAGRGECGRGRGAHTRDCRQDGSSSGSASTAHVHCGVDVGGLELAAQQAVGCLQDGASQGDVAMSEHSATVPSIEEDPGTVSCDRM